MGQIQKFATQYVALRLNGLSIGITVDAAVSSAAPIIATHNGTFHCDEALACGLLRHLAPYKEASIVRTRDTSTIDGASIVVDVGGVYDHAKLRYDHHQGDFHHTMVTDKKTYLTRLSSAGLVYKHYGKELIQEYIRDILSSSMREHVLQITKWNTDRKELTEKEISILFDVVYRGFVEEVDGVDNGVELFRIEASNDMNHNHEEGEAAIASKAVMMKENYSSNTNLSSRVGKLHSWWNDPSNGDIQQENAAFAEAMELAAVEFFQAVSLYAFSWLPARAVVEKAFHNSTNVHPSGGIVVLESAGCPWKAHLFSLEEEHKVVGRSLYVLFSDGRSWRVQAVPVEPNAFATRKPLPFKGLRGEELSKASGIEGGVFVHVSGFIGGMTSYESALALAVKALETSST